MAFDSWFHSREDWAQDKICQTKNSFNLLVFDYRSRMYLLFESGHEDKADR